MASTLIIGYGNPLRGDDGLGRRAAQRLKAELREDAVIVIGCHQLTPELAEPISRADMVIFIDAAEVKPAGRIFCRRIESATAPSAPFSHHLTPAALLGWARELYGCSPEAIVFSVSGENFGFSEELSPDVSKVLPELIERVCELVRCRKKQDAERGHA